MEFFDRVNKILQYGKNVSKSEHSRKADYFDQGAASEVLCYIQRGTCGFIVAIYNPEVTAVCNDTAAFTSGSSLWLPQNPVNPVNLVEKFLTGLTGFTG